MTELLNVIRGRKSVRSFDGNPLRSEDREKLEQTAAAITNPFGIPVRFVFLDAAENGLSSPVLTGEKMYVAGIVEKKPYADVAFGYALEQLVLTAWSMGIGTTWIGGTMKRELFEKAAGVQAGEMMPCMSPLGYPAKKKSVKETLMRKGVGADNRLPAEKLFFQDSFDQPLSGQQAAELGDLIEMVRWAPSAVNKQPWRVVIRDGQAHFYEKKDKGYVGEATGDLQKIDVGIALSHFVMGLKEQNRQPEVMISDPGIQTPENTEYIASVRF
ncbi:MAG: nitroreductase family protein [Lachnospiraceae bacterium]|nr:nitroreductase family protein [Lachnospiraceae bacterium]